MTVSHQRSRRCSCRKSIKSVSMPSHNPWRKDGLTRYTDSWSGANRRRIPYPISALVDATAKNAARKNSINPSGPASAGSSQPIISSQIPQATIMLVITPTRNVRTVMYCQSPFNPDLSAAGKTLASAFLTGTVPVLSFPSGSAAPLPDQDCLRIPRRQIPARLQQCWLPLQKPRLSSHQYN